MLILGIDTTANAASVAVTSDEKLVGEFYINTKLTHSQTLLPMVKSLLDSIDLKLDDIDLFAVNKGPGSFTGLRIGISAVKGLSFSLKKPCCGVSTLESMANTAKSINGIICCVMDARCRQVYNAIFACSNGNLKRLCEDRAIAVDELIKELHTYRSPVYFVGDGADLFKDPASKFNIAQENIKYSHAYGVCMSALRCENIVSADKLMPSYLRLSQAERERNARICNSNDK